MNNPATAASPARNEIELAADVLWRLFDVGILPQTAIMVARVAKETGVPSSALQQASRRPFREPSARRIPPSVAPITAPAPSTSRNLDRANKKRFDAKNPEPGQRICSRCKETKPVEEFDIKNRKTGQLKSFCRPCVKEYQADRYLSAAKAEALNTARLEFTVAEGDGVIGLSCLDCGAAVAAGDVVWAKAGLHHRVCP